MRIGHILDEGLFGRLPLPLAQLYRRAHHAKTPRGRHHASYYLWEASLRLLGSALVVEYMERGADDPELDARLANLERPALGHWWEFVWRLVPVLAGSDPGDSGVRRTRNLALGSYRGDLPRACGLDVELRRALGMDTESRSTVRVRDLFKRLVKYRNREFGHGAVGLKPDDFYERMGDALLAGIPEVLRYLDTLAGRRLMYIADVRRQASGSWLVERQELIGERGRRLESLAVPESDAQSLPTSGRVYLMGGRYDEQVNLKLLHSLHPLVEYDHESRQFFFLNALRGSSHAEYLCYSSGEVVARTDPISESREPLATILRQLGTGEGRVTGERPSRLSKSPTPGSTKPGLRQWIGEYQIISRIGRGGMGVVYRAWQPSLERQVALKCLFSAGDEKVEERFSREIRALGRVEHPHLVKIFTSGSDGPNWFYTMELIEGAELASVCDHLAGAITSEVGEAEWAGALSGACLEARNREKQLSSDAAVVPAEPETPSQGTERIPDLDSASDKQEVPTSLSSSCGDIQRGVRGGDSYIRRVVEVIRQVAEAAHSLHRAGVIHRDIKPGNIMLTTDGSQAVLMDLGLAQLADEAEGKLTRTCQFVGTLRYASPEQVHGADLLDERSDIYNLGATLWELLTLRPIFAAGEKTSTPELMRRIQTEEPESVRRHNPRVPADLEAIVLKCLDKEPSRRYATAEDLAADLSRWLNGEAVYARAPTLRYVLGKYVRRHRLRLATVGFFILLALFGAVIGIYRMDRARRVAEDALFDVSTSMGLEATGRGSLAEAVLWFSHAASLARDDPEKLLGSMVRMHTWSLAIPRPLRAFMLKPGKIRDLVFHASGKYILVSHWDAGPLLLELDAGTQEPLLSGAVAALCAAWNPEGSLLALGTSAGAVEIHRFPGGGLVHSVPHTEPSSTLAFSPDGNLLALGGSRVRVWNLRKRAFVTQELVHPAVAHCMVFDGCVGRLATACEDGKVRVYALNQESGKAELLFDPVAHGWDPQRLGHIPPVFVEKDRGILTLSSSAAMTWRDVDTGEPVRELAHEDRASLIRAVLSPDESYVALCGWRAVRLWDVRTGVAVGTPMRHLNEVETVSFSPDSQMLITASRDRTARIWSVPSGKPLSAPLPHQGDVMTAVFSPDGIHFTTGMASALVRVWGLPEENRGNYRLDKESGETFIRLSPDGQYFLQTGTPRAFLSTCLSTRVHVVESGRAAGPRLVPGGILLGAEFSPDGERVVTLSSRSTRKYERNWISYRPADHPGSIQVWDWQTGKRLLGPLSTPSEPVGAAYNADGTALWVLCSGGELQVIDARTGAIRQELNHGEELVERPTLVRRAVQLSPDGQYFVTSGIQKKARVWDADAYSPRYPALVHGGLVFDTCFSADGAYLCTTTQNGEAIVRDFSTGNTVSVLIHGDSVFDASFSPDGRYVLTACRDRMAHLWDWRTGRKVCPEMIHEDQVLGAQFSRHGLWILTVTHGGRLHVWEGKTGKPVAPPRDLLHAAPDIIVCNEGDHVIVPTWGETIHVIQLADWISPVPEDVSLEDLRVYAELLSGRGILEEGGAYNLTTKQWYDRWQHLEQAHEWYFELDTSTGRRANWHRRRAALYEQSLDWDAALWHLKRLEDYEKKVPPMLLAKLHRYVRCWRFASRVEPWDDTSSFVPMDSKKLAEIRASALQADMVHSRGPFVDFSYFLPGRTQYAAGYVCRKIRTDQQRTVRILAGSNDALRAWINDVRVHENLTLRLANPDQDEFDVTLPAGESTLLVEVSQAERAWGLYLRFEDDQGRDLRLLDDGRLLPSP